MRITSAVSVDAHLTGHRCTTKTQIRQKKGLNVETAQNIAVIRTKKPGEYAKRRGYLSGKVSLRARNISGRQCIYGECEWIWRD